MRHERAIGLRVQCTEHILLSRHARDQRVQHHQSTHLAPNALTCPKWLCASNTTGVLHKLLWGVRCLQRSEQQCYKEYGSLLMCEHARMYVQAQDAGVLQKGLLNVRDTANACK